MDVRARNTNEKIKIGVVEMFSNGKEDAIKPFEMETSERPSWNNHAFNVISIIKKYVPNAEIHLVPNTKEGIEYLIQKEVKITNVSLRANFRIWWEELAKVSYLVISAGNDSEKGESNLAQRMKGCVVGAVNKNLIPQPYSSYGLGVVKTVAQTGINYGNGILNGTSFASPVIAALLSQWYIWYKENTGYYPNIKEANQFVKINSHDIFEYGKDLKTGYGLFRLPHTFEAQKTIMPFEGDEGLIIKYTEGKENIIEKIKLNIPSRIENERTLVGSRDIAEAFNLNVQYNVSKKESYYIRG